MNIAIAADRPPFVTLHLLQAASFTRLIPVESNQSIKPQHQRETGALTVDAFGLYFFEEFEEPKVALESSAQLSTDGSANSLICAEEIRCRLRASLLAEFILMKPKQ
jgi:hypothetical protein